MVAFRITYDGIGSKADEKAKTAELWDIHIDDAIPSVAYRRIHYGES